MASKLRGKTAREMEEFKRLKLLVSGPSGSGKSSLVASFPRCYIIDTEAGVTNYGELIERSGSKVLQTTEPKVVVEELRTLLSEDHEFLTVAIDPITNLWHESLEEAANVVGESYGKHYGKAGQEARRMVALLQRLDMNFIFTAHQKEVYAPGGAVIDTTFDGWRKSDYVFDLWLKTKVQKVQDPKGGGRIVFSATVAKTRIAGFPPLSEFPLGEYDSAGRQNMQSYEALCERFGRSKLEAPAVKIELATAEQVGEARELVEKVNPSQEWLKQCYKYAGSEEIADFSKEHISRFIQRLKEMKSL